MILVEKVCSRLPFTYWVRIPYAASSDQDKEEGDTEEEEEGVASRRFLPAHLAPVPAHLLDCLSCQHIRGGQQSLYNNKLVTVDVVAHCRCGGSLEAHQTSGAEVPGSNPASTTMILMRCRIIVKYSRKSRGREGNLPLRQKKYLKK